MHSVLQFVVRHVQLQRIIQKQISFWLGFSFCTKVQIFLSCIEPGHEKDICDTVSEGDSTKHACALAALSQVPLLTA